MKVKFSVLEEVFQSGRENTRVHNFGVVESLQGQMMFDLQPAQVTKGARTAWRARFDKNKNNISILVIQSARK